MMTRSAARYAVDVAAHCSAALLVVSVLTHSLGLSLAGIALMVACGGLLTVVRDHSH